MSLDKVGAGVGWGGWANLELVWALCTFLKLDIRKDSYLSYLSFIKSATFNFFKLLHYMHYSLSALMIY